MRWVDFVRKKNVHHDTYLVDVRTQTVATDPVFFFFFVARGSPCSRFFRFRSFFFFTAWSGSRSFWDLSPDFLFRGPYYFILPSRGLFMPHVLVFSFFFLHRLRTEIQNFPSLS